ncbi:hypothetical protein PZA11_003865 [Diplocarpon coronariae]
MASSSAAPVSLGHSSTFKPYSVDFYPLAHLVHTTKADRNRYGVVEHNYYRWFALPKPPDLPDALQNSILRSLISESSPAGGTPSYKYAVNSTIIQHLVPTSSLSRAKNAQESAVPKTEASDAAISTSDAKNGATGTDGKPRVGRRGMHSATGAYWNEKTDGMWSFKYEGGENKGLDVVISVIWISI